MLLHASPTHEYCRYSPRGTRQLQEGKRQRALLCLALCHRQFDRHNPVSLCLFDIVCAHHVLGNREFASVEDGGHFIID